MKFIPRVLLSAPRRSAGVPNPSATTVLYTSNNYSFEHHKKTVELRILDVESGESHELAKNDEVSDFIWLDDDTFAYLQAEKDGTSSIYVASVSQVVAHTKDGQSHYVAGTVAAAAANLKLCRLDQDGNHFAAILSAPANPDGSLYTTEQASRRTRSTGRLYDGLFVRHWDHYATKETSALWFGTLSRKNKDAKYELSKLTNALKGTGLECPIQPFGGADTFDINRHAIIFTAKDPRVNPALNTKCNIYLLHVDSWTQSHPPKLQTVEVPGYEGAATSPVLSSEGKKAAFLMMRENRYEADKNHVFVIPDIDASSPELAATAIAMGGLTGDSPWDRSPQSIAFSTDAKSLLLTAEDQGFGKLFSISLEPGDHNGQAPRSLTTQGYVSDVRPLRDGRVFVSGSSLVCNSWYGIVEPQTKRESVMAWSHSNSGEGNKFGLSPKQVSHIWSPASNPKVNKEVHSIVVKPSVFDSSKKYPVAYLIHGGPQGSWADSWSTRWNPAVFAEQGYIVVAPNPTGSTGYGQAFTDSIKQNWGGNPYEDIVRVFEWVGENMKEADNSRAVALGASYGGYMVSLPTESVLPDERLTCVDELDPRSSAWSKDESACLP